MKHIFLFSLVCMLTLSGFCQQNEDSGEISFLDRFTDYNFKGHFCAMVESDDVSNYYLLDFSMLPSRFERIYFMNLSFSSNQIVNIGFEPSRNIAGFKAHQNNREDAVIKIFNDLLEKTKKISGLWSPDQQTTWLNENDKYK